MTWFIVLFALLMPFAAHGAVYGEWGLGLNSGQTQTKYAEFGIENETPYIADYRFGVGGWLDKSDVPGVKDSVYAHLTLGIQPRLDPFRIGYFIGPGIISDPDSRLGSNMQVVHKLILGFKDFRGASVSLVYTHFSNGGAKAPNLGRDFGGLQVQF